MNSYKKLTRANPEGLLAAMDCEDNGHHCCEYTDHPEKYGTFESIQNAVGLGNKYILTIITTTSEGGDSD